MRYTFKIDGKYVWNYDDLPPKDFEINAKNKFGMLEDLEEEIGCPLEVYVKTIRNGEIYTNVNGKFDYADVKIIGIGNDDDSEPNTFLAKRESVFATWFMWKDYKKTWWLKENREE